MGAPTTSEVYVGKPANGTGGVLYAALGTTLPGGVNASTASFTDAGYIGEDGVPRLLEQRGVRITQMHERREIE